MAHVKRNAVHFGEFSTSFDAPSSLFRAVGKYSRGERGHRGGVERVLNGRAIPVRGEPKHRRRPRAPRRYLLSPARAATYAASVAAMVLLASVDRFGGAFALGLFAGLCYARSNLLVVAPAYILSVIAFSPTPWTLLCVAVPVGRWRRSWCTPCPRCSTAAG